MALGFIKFLGKLAIGFRPFKVPKTSKYTINGLCNLLKRNFKALEGTLLLREY